MPTEFDFEVSDRLKREFPELCHKYHAEEIDKDTYEISWINDEDAQPFAYYTKEDIEYRIKNKDWIVKE